MEPDILPATMKPRSWEATGLPDGNQAHIEGLVETNITASMGEEQALLGDCGWGNIGPRKVNGQRISKRPVGSLVNGVCAPSRSWPSQGASLTALQSSASDHTEGIC